MYIVHTHDNDDLSLLRPVAAALLSYESLYIDLDSMLM